MDPHSIPHQYRATFQAPGGKAMQGHGTIVVHDQDVYFVTARHVIEGTNAATTFRALRRGGQDVDVAAVRLDWSRSREALAKVRRATDVSPLDSLVTVARANAGDRGGKILLFSSEIYGEFDFTLRLAIPMTPALWYLHSVLNRTTGILKDALNTPLSKAPYGLRHQITYFNTVSDICVIGPEDFSDERRPGVVKAQGRSGSDTYSEELEYEGPFVAVSHTKIPGIGRSLLFSERSDSVATLLRLMRAQEAPKVEIGSIPGLTLQPLSKWRTTVTPPARGGH